MGGLPDRALWRALILSAMWGQGHEMVDLEHSQHRVLNLKMMSRALDRKGYLGTLARLSSRRQPLGSQTNTMGELRVTRGTLAQGQPCG